MSCLEHLRNAASRNAGSCGAHIALLSMLLAISPPASAQCGDWRSRGGMYLRGVVHASVSWDPDGGGPFAPRLVAGGSFQRAGAPTGVPASNIAAWDGDSWQALGGGTNGSVLTLCAFDGDLIAAGRFTDAGGQAVNYIARWDGAAWHALGGGVTDAGGDAIVRDMVVYNGELIVGGNFTHAGGQPATDIARWDGTTWRPVGDPIDETSGASFWCLEVYNDDLIAGGDFRVFDGVHAVYNVARWNPALPDWQGLAASGMNSKILDLAVYANQLIACGDFTYADGPADRIARWNGSIWQSLGDGLGTGVGVAAVETYDGELYAGGHFATAGGEPASNIARWDGSGWSSVRAGTDAQVLALSVHNGELIAGGIFSRAGGNDVDALARWDGENWRDISGVANAATGIVSDIEVWADKVVLAGTFATQDAGERTGFVRLAMWDGIELSRFGTPDDAVFALAPAPGDSPSTTDLIIGGAFTEIYDGDAPGYEAASRIARINDTLPTGWQAMGAGFNGNVNAIAYYNGSIYAAGSFSMSGSTPVNHIARWNSSTWVPVGAGVNGVNGTVYALKVYNGQLYVGGVFNYAGGSLTGKLARWNGVSWSACGGSFVATFVEALEVYNDELIIGGYFGGASPNIKRYNGLFWFDFGPGGTDDAVRALTVSNGTLLLGGDFTNAGGVAADHIARWDGSVFSAIHGGTDGPVCALAAYRSEIQVGGAFTAVRNGAFHSELWARHSETGAPWIARQPESDTVNCGGQAGFHAWAAEGYGPQFQWRKDGVLLVDGPTGTGSNIIVNGNDLYVQNAGPDDEGTYQATIFNNCGGDISEPVTLTVANCCPNDLDGDDSVGLSDLAILLAHFGQSTGAHFADGDLDDDGDVDLGDLALLLASFGNACR